MSGWYLPEQADVWEYPRAVHLEYHIQYPQEERREWVEVEIGGRAIVAESIV